MCLQHAHCLLHCTVYKCFVREQIIVVAQLRELIAILEYGSRTGRPLLTGQDALMSRMVHSTCLDELQSVCGLLIEEGGAQYDQVSREVTALHN